MFANWILTIPHMAHLPKLNLWARLSVWHNRVRERRALAELDLHMLEDIGVSPDEVRREVAKPFWVL